MKTIKLLVAALIAVAWAEEEEPCVDKLPNCQKNLGLCTADGELVFQHHYCRSTCGNCFGNTLEAIVPPCPAEYPPVTPSERAAFTSGQLRLAWDLYKSIPVRERVRKGANFAIAPFSISAMLATLHAGASGSTKATLKRFPLFQHMNESEIEHVYSKMQNIMRRQMMQPLPKATELYQANLLYFGEQFKIRQQYRDKATGCYDTTLFRRKEDDNPPQIKEEINKAIQGMSFGTVKKRLLDPNDTTVDLNPRHLTLVNAAYLKTDFDVYPVVNQKFYPPTQRDGVEAPMIMIEGHVRYHSVHMANLRFHVLGMDMIYGTQTLYIILPYSRYGLTRLERTLTGDMLDRIIHSAHKDAWKDTLLLPKFHAGSNLDLKPFLEQLGLETVFSHPKLDEIFLGHKVPKPIANFYHRTDYKMYEDYAIDDSVAMKEKLTGLPGKANTFLATHPFLFLIKDKQTGAIITFGRVLNPAKTETK